MLLLKTELVMVRKDEKINSWTGKLGHYNRFCLKLDYIYIQYRFNTSILSSYSPNIGII